MFTCAIPPGVSFSDGTDSVEEFSRVLTVFAGAISSGWLWALCIQLFTALRSGRFSPDGRCFWTVEFWSLGRSMEDWTFWSISSAVYNHTVGVHFRDGVIGVLVSNRSMSLLPACTRSKFSLQRVGPSGRTYNTRFYPSWLRLPWAADGQVSCH